LGIITNLLWVTLYSLVIPIELTLTKLIYPYDDTFLVKRSKLVYVINDSKFL
jgi:hypothetical protein